MIKTNWPFTTRVAGAFALGAALLLSAPAGSQAQVLSADWDFADGTLQGWSVFGSSGDYVFGAVEDGSGQGWVFNPGAHSGDFQLAQILFENDDFNAAHDTSWARSPEFRITAATEITFQIWGRAAFEGDGSVAGDWDIGNMDNAANVPDASSDTGFVGLALRRVSDGEFVALGGKNDGDANSWSAGWWNADISSFADPVETYTIDVIDQRDGGWGGIGVDTISVIPEPSTYALLAGLGMLGLVVLRRRFRK